MKSIFSLLVLCSIYNYTNAINLIWQDKDSSILNEFNHTKEFTNTNNSHDLNKPILCFWTGWTPVININDLNFNAYGSELALKSLAEELSSRFQVFIFGITNGETIVNNVKYIHISRMKKFLNDNIIEVMIISRQIHYFLLYSNLSNVKRTYFWFHDIHIITYEQAIKIADLPAFGHYLFKLALTKIDGIITLTEWHKQHIINRYDLQKYMHKVFIIGNAIDTSRYTNHPEVKKVKNRFIWTSGIDRGLSRLVAHIIKLRDILPDAELYIYRDSIQYYSSEYKSLRETIEKTEFIHFKGRISPDEMIIRQLESDYWYYPTQFEETYCISALEAQLAGCVIIASNKAALQNVVSTRGVLIYNENFDSQEYFDEVVKYFYLFRREEELKNKVRELGLKWAKQQNWQNRACEWLDMFGIERLLCKKRVNS